MIDQLIIGDKGSFDDFSASMAFRVIKPPKKKSIKETVPFSNVTHDFSAINGELYWEERELEYTFELTADTPEELEELKRKFTAWVMQVQKQELHDPYIPDYHFVGTYESMEVEDDEGMDKTTLTVAFTAYPYMVANLPKVYEALIGYLDRYTINVVNDSDHPVTPTITCNGTFSIVFGDTHVDFAGQVSSLTDGRIKLPKGVTSVILLNPGITDANFSMTFREEVI